MSFDSDCGGVEMGGGIFAPPNQLTDICSLIRTGVYFFVFYN